MDDFAQQAAREIANYEVRRGQAFNGSKIRCSIRPDPLEPDIFEWSMVDVTPEIRAEADHIREMKKSAFKSLSDDEILDNIAQAVQGYFVALLRNGGVTVKCSGKMGKDKQLVHIAQMQTSQPQFLQNEFFEKDPTSGPMIDMMIALQWRYDAVYGVAFDDKGHQQTWAHNIDAMLEPLVRLLSET